MNFFSKPQRFVVYFDESIHGLDLGSPVKLRGVRVGRVADLVVMVNADGTRAAAEFTIQGIYLVADEGLPPAHGQTYVLPVGAFFTLREGRIARVTNYYNLEDWLRQVGS